MKNNTTGVSDEQYLLALARMRMPFGKYKDRYLVNLPEQYLIWFQRRGFPAGTLGRMLSDMLEIKTNGLEYLIRPLIKN
ncbi:MAG: DUF3820 family protein [Chitinivibrionales bacterium]